LPRLQLWEASHLGGHRFAATALSMPSGQMWGRLRADDAPSLIGHLAQDAVWPERYRGRIDLAPDQQIAEAVGHDRLQGRPGRVEVEPDGQAAAIVRIFPSDALPEAFRITCEIAAFTGGNSCSDLTTPGAQWTRPTLATVAAVPLSVPPQHNPT
jgi:hypothetical protein